MMSGMMARGIERDKNERRETFHHRGDREQGERKVGQAAFLQVKFRTFCTRRKECGTRHLTGHTLAEEVCGIIAPAVMSMEKHHESQKSAPPFKTKNMLRQQLPHAHKPSMGHPKRQRQQPRPPAVAGGADTATQIYLPNTSVLIPQ